MEDFYTAVEFAKKIEKNALPQIQFSNEIEIVKTIDLEPREIEDMTFADFINLYEKSQKVISATNVLGMESARDQTPIVSIQSKEKDETFDVGSVFEKQSEQKTYEVETKVRALTTESLKKAEELSKEFEKPIEVPLGITEERKKPLDDLGSLELDFERHEGVLPQVTDTKKIQEREPEKIENSNMKEEITPAIPEEQESIQELVKPIAEKPRIQPTPLPSILNETKADEAAQAKYNEIENYLRQEWGGDVDEDRIKKKMLSLTKELFKEKSTNRREQIKLEIVVLKNMLGQIKKGGVKKAPGKEQPKGAYSENVYETIISTQKVELATAKDTIQSEFSEKITMLKHAYFDTVREANQDTEKIQEAYDTLEKGLLALTDRAGRLIEKTKSFMIQKHSLELKNARESASLKMTKEIQEQEGGLTEKYTNDFDHLKEMMIKRIQALQNTAAQTAKPSNGMEKEEQTPPTVYEINETDEGTLLYYLHSKDAEYYKKYERHHISRTEALDYAKIVMAKEKGLSARTITKYFGTVVNEDT